MEYVAWGEDYTNNIFRTNILGELITVNKGNMKTFLYILEQFIH